MKQLFRVFGALIFLMLITGCGDPVLSRRVVIDQIGTQRITGNVFDVDASGIPKDWIESRENRETRFGTHTSIRLSPERRVKIMLVPADNP